MEFMKVTLVAFYEVYNNSIENALRLDKDYMEYNPTEFLNIRKPRIRVTSEEITKEQYNELSETWRFDK